MENNQNHWSLSNIIGVVGAVLLGSGVISIIASNWDGIPDFLKVILAVSVFVFLEFAGFLLIEIKKMVNLGIATVFAGVLCYGGSIFLIGQIFNLQLDWTDGFLYWFLGAGLLAYIYNSKILKYTCLSILGIGVIGQLTFWNYYSNVKTPSLISDTQTMFLLSVSSFLAFLLSRQSRQSLPENFQQYL